MLVSIILIILFACDHGFKRNNKVANRLRAPQTQNQDNYITSSRPKLSSRSRLTHNNDFIDTNDDYNYPRLLSQTSGIYSNHHSFPYSYPQPYYNQQAPIDVNERPGTTVIKEFHHHYVPDNGTRIFSSKPTSSRLMRNSARSISQIPIMNNEVETYQLNSNTGQLNLVNQMAMMPPPEEQLVTFSQQPRILTAQNGGNWAVYNNNIPIIQQQQQQFVLVPQFGFRNPSYQQLQEDYDYN
jgi:hypothetical protein